MTEFTKEEISLCKQVAKKYRKKIEKGDWYWSNAYDNILLAMDYGFQPAEQEYMGVFKVWTISDCLEFLKKKCQDHVLLIHEENLDDDEEWYLWLDEYKETQQWDKGKTPLEACLKVILTVLGEKKSGK